MKILKYSSLYKILVEDDLDAHNIYWNTEQKCRKYSKIMFYFVILEQTLIIYALVVSIYDITNGSYDTSGWALPFFISVPFNTETLFGWYLLAFINVNISFAYSLGSITLTSYFISCCFYICAACEHYDLNIGRVTIEVELNQHEKNALNCMDREQNIRIHLCKAINTHNKLYE